MSNDLFERDGDEKSEVRLGESVLRLRGGAPDAATGCLRENGEVTDAICLATHGDEQVWARRIGSNNPLHRRGRFIIEPGVAFRFIDDASADVSAGHLIVRPSLERDLAMSRRIQDTVTSKVFALLLYIALHAVSWRHTNSGEIWSGTWRSAGDIIDRLRGDDGFAMWYLLSYEQTLERNYLDEAVVTEIATLGWTPIFETSASE